ncbi:hypothetical protein IJJ36_04010 [Candidatus Saccharibacteria bacterium]|nr:hypothetical protein [Candidatus Saccharibacteria bacterium]MBQ6461562.1 hypothetical protein [Candidatus Saccharibacteria bacterium]
MKNKFTKLITAVVVTLSALIFTATPAFACTETNQVACAQSICNCQCVSAEIKKASGCPGADTYDLGESIINIINGVLLVLGLVAVIVIIVGGVQYMTSSGDAGKTQKAKNTILYAVIGLVICALSVAIVNFVIRTIYNQNRTEGVASYTVTTFTA